MSFNWSFEVEGSAEQMKTELHANGHTIVISEPEDMGGKDEGLDPLSTFLSSLAGCENVIANMVAKEIDFDLKSIGFTVKGELDSRGLLGQEGVQPYFHTVYIDAEVNTSESQARIDELREKVDARCPVYTTLEAAGVELKTNWTKA
ncbi:OsmC family protein [Salsuginibacillus kocurii]|uniref:OsmC family protein n=1 Tax=Salsuginibacillus kocurii TaxID=427078 RepID=UPI00035F3A73|nr:OsmC family protein [Salsuginibacillus kocurii]